MLTRKQFVSTLFASLVFCFAAPAMSASLYGIDITVGDEVEMLSFDTVEEVYETFDQDELGNLFDGYGGTERVSADIDYRGIAVGLAFAMGVSMEDSLSSALTFTVPRLGISEVFEGMTRDESVDLLEDFLEGDGSNIINDINKLLVAESSVDPLAGNPSSLLGSTVSNAFSTATGTGGGDQAAAATTNQTPRTGQGWVGLGARFGRYSQGGKDVTVYTLPLGYTRETESGKTFSINAPITYVKTESADSYKVSLEFSYKHPMTEQWSLTPTLGYGLVGSSDLLSAGQLGSFALTSLYEFKQRVGAGGWKIGIANMAGYYETFPIEISGVKIDPDIANQVIKNGLIGTLEHNLFGQQSTTQLYLTDTRFFGDELYSEQYNEVGVFVKPNYTRGIKRFLGLNATYLFGEGDVEGVKLSFTYNF